MPVFPWASVCSLRNPVGPRACGAWALERSLQKPAVRSPCLSLALSVVVCDAARFRDVLSRVVIRLGCLCVSLAADG
eukprot:1952764-Pyramimonas_sp.AAC.1